MKKKIKFVTLPVLKIKDAIVVLTSAILLAAATASLCFFISGNLSSEMIKMTLSLGINKAYTLPDINIAKTMLSVSVPTLTFTTPTQPIKAENLTLNNPPTVELPTQALNESITQSITYKSAEEKGYRSIDGIYVNNQTGKSFDTKELLNKNLDLSLSDEPNVLIVHTHTTESYTPSEKYNYTPSETDRTTDYNFNMAAVGEVIYNHLTSQGINTIHDKTINDYPSYSTSYSKSLKLVEAYMQKYPSIKIVIDVHRDAIVTQSGTKMRPLAASSPPCAQVMMVIGTNDSGLNHPNWKTNLAFALKLQHKMNELYPSLARPINLRRERFNQHSAPYAFILEVGTNGNTLEEAKEGAQLFSASLVSLLKN